MARIVLLLTLLGLAASPPARDPALESALRDLSSPFEEVRLRALQRLTHAGREVREPLLGLYPKADFRTKALVLDTFAARRDAEGVELVFGDLLTADLAVRSAQRNLLSALFAEVRDLAARNLVPLLRGDWRREEAVRTLPARASFPRGVLAELVRSEDPGRSEPAGEIASRTETLDEIRRRLALLETEGSTEVSSRARSLLLHLARHDVERGLLAVNEAGSEGYYDGMYVRLAEIVRESFRLADCLSILGYIVRDEPWPEAGVNGTPGATYGNLEPVPRDIGRWGVREVAAQALGDVGEGDEELAAALAEWLRERRPQYDEVGGFDYTLALSLAALGQTGPIQSAIADFRFGLENLRPGPWTEIEHERLTMRLAGCYGRLGRHREAADIYRGFLRESGERAPITRYNLACALARDGQPEAALDELARAVRYGYGWDPSQITWLERDGDLDSLRDRPGYARLLEAARRR